MRFGWIILVAACGGGQASTQPTSTTSTSSLADTPADKCFALAGAKREKKANEPAKITVKHVLVKYAGAKNASFSITRTREQACLRAQEAYAKLEGGTSFADLVKEYSDEQGAATREGSIGSIQRSDVDPAFANAAFELEPSSVSHIVESPFGFHIIFRAE